MVCHYPRVCISFCTKCRWNLRAAWYTQELLSTFGPALGEVAMAPADSGVFRVTLTTSPSSDDILLWDRKEQGGFPDAKELKQRVRDVIEPEKSLGHSDKVGGLKGGDRISAEPSDPQEKDVGSHGIQCEECADAEKELN